MNFSVGCIFSGGDRVKTGYSTPSPDMVNPGISGVDPGTSPWTVLRLNADLKVFSASTVIDFRHV